MKVIAIIPARLDSKRFPRKVLYNLKGKPFIAHLYDTISKSKEIDKVIIASSDKEILDGMNLYGAKTIKTSTRHKTGSDRAAEVAKKIKADIYVNIQGDNFGLKINFIDSVIRKFKNEKSLQFATMANKIKDIKDLHDSNNVKVVLDKNSNAIYFSRSVIPHLQNLTKKNHTSQFTFYHHIGIYLFRRNGLIKFANWKQSSLEKAESLEQLRIVENFEKIRVYKTKMTPVSIDTRTEMKKIEKKYK